MVSALLTNIYILIDGFAYNTRGYFASCVVFFPSPEENAKARSKMSARIIYKTIRLRDLLFHYKNISLFWLLFFW